MDHGGLSEPAIDAVTTWGYLGSQFIEHHKANPCPGYPDFLTHFDGLVRERRNSSALAMELRLSSINPLIYLICITPDNTMIFLQNSEGEVWSVFCEFVAWSVPRICYCHAVIWHQSGLMEETTLPRMSQGCLKTYHWPFVSGIHPLQHCSV